MIYGIVLYYVVQNRHGCHIFTAIAVCSRPTLSRYWHNTWVCQAMIPLIYMADFCW